MCGRYSILRSRREHEKFFQAVMEDGFEILERYNAAPRQKLPVVITENGNRQIISMQWGHTPSWAKDTAHETRINTRSETLMRADHKNIITNHRCIIPASGFYEWDKSTQARTPYYFYAKQNDFLSFAGIWEHNQLPSGELIKTFTIITTKADDTISRVHNRMPLMLNKILVDIWLDPKTNHERLYTLLRPRNSHLSSHPVSNTVNNPRIDNPSCILEEQPKQPCLL